MDIKKDWLQWFWNVFDTEIKITGESSKAKWLLGNDLKNYHKLIIRKLKKKKFSGQYLGCRSCWFQNTTRAIDFCFVLLMFTVNTLWLFHWKIKKTETMVNTFKNKMKWNHEIKSKTQKTVGWQVYEFCSRSIRKLLDDSGSEIGSTEN